VTHKWPSFSRLKLLEKKKTELALKSRKEIADYVSSGKVERAKIRVEHIIREDYLVEAMEILEMYCDLLLARYWFDFLAWAGFTLSQFLIMKIYIRRYVLYLDLGS